MRPPRLDGADGHQPDPNAPWWTCSDVARYLGVVIGTVSSYRGRGQMPPATGQLGASPVWRPEVIIAWQRGRSRSRRATMGER